MALILVNTYDDKSCTSLKSSPESFFGEQESLVDAGSYLDVQSRTLG